MVVVWCYTKALSSFGEKSAPLMWLTVDHPYVDTVEVICYERTTDQFAERIYFHRGPVFAKLDVESLQERLLLEKKNALRHRESFDEQKTRIAILNKAMADYIIDRLDLLEFSPLHLVVDFKQSDAEILVCSKPANLTATHHAQKNSVLVRHEDVERALVAVQAAKKAVVEERDKANHLEHLVRNLSIRKEWWRLPFVIAKVAKGNALSDSDALLWKMVLKNEAAYFSVTAENSFDMDSPFTNNPGHTIAALKLAEDESNLSRSGGGENNDKAAATTRAVVKKNRWGASVTRAKLPPLQRKNSLSVGIAALSSSLQRTLQGFYSSVSSSTSASNTTSISNSATTSTCCSAAASASAAAAQATAAQHMGAAVGLHFDSEVRPLVLPKPEPVVLSFAEIVLAHKHTKQNQQQQLQQLQSTGPDADAGADASAAFSVSQKVHSPHRRASRSLLNQEQPVAHMPQKAAPHHRAAASISPFSPFFSPSFSSSSSSSVHSHWTGQRVHDPPRRTGRSDASKEFSSEEQRQARRILNRLRGGKAATEKEEGQGSCSGNMCAGSAEKKNNDVDSVAPSTQVVLIKPSAALHGTKQRFSLHGTVAVAPTGTTNQ